MKSDRFVTVEIENCLRNRHKFKLVGSDKTPLRRHLSCLTCSERTGKSAFVAYGEEAKSWGLWRHTSKRELEKFTEEIPQGETS